MIVINYFNSVSYKKERDPAPSAAEVRSKVTVEVRVTENAGETNLGTSKVIKRRGRPGELFAPLLITLSKCYFARQDNNVNTTHCTDGYIYQLYLVKYYAEVYYLHQK